MKYITTLFILVFLCFSCKSRKTVTYKKTKEDIKEVAAQKKEIIEKEISISKKDMPFKKKNTKTTYTDKVNTYINTYKNIAKQEMHEYGIPASITLAQGILESGAGEGRLSIEANNHFGIKCHGWQGEKIYHDDDKDQECFRKYNNAKYSFRDHSLFLSERKRYQKLFTLKKDDYKNWAKELRKAGYATDIKYPQKLISLIERYNLSQYDNDVLRSVGVLEKKKKETKRLTHRVSKGDTLYAISKRYNVSIDQIKQVNNLKTNSLSIGQTLLINIPF